MNLYLCVDCGGSKTSAVVCDGDGNVVGRAYGGPSNYAYLTLEAFSNAVRLAISDALKTCTTPPAIEPVSLPPPFPIAAAWFGVSGVDSPTAVAAITPVLSSMLGIPEGPRLAIANDTHLLAAPLRMYSDVSQAVTVIAGTGSIAVSFESREGNLHELGRIGGWGWVLGDEGGGYHVGREAVRQILLEDDRASVAAKPSPSGTLQPRVLSFLSAKTVPDMLTSVHWPDPPAAAGQLPNVPAYALMSREKRLSSLAPLVFASAFEDGDPLALKVLQVCAATLASEILVLLGKRSEDFPKLVSAEDSVISFGGSLVGIPAYRQLILDDLASKGHTFRHVEFVEDAAKTGAIGLAVAFEGQPK